MKSRILSQYYSQTELEALGLNFYFYYMGYITLTIGLYTTLILYEDGYIWRGEKILRIRKISIYCTVKAVIVL